MADCSSHCNSSSSVLCQRCWLLTAPDMVMMLTMERAREDITCGAPPSFLSLHSAQHLCQHGI